MVHSHSYGTLKEAVISRIFHTEDPLIRQLVQGIHFGNKKPWKPSQGWRHLKAAPFDNDPISGELWIQRLPSYLLPVLRTTRKCSLEETTEVADDIILRYSPGVSALKTHSGLPEPHPQLHRTNQQLGLRHH